MSRRELKSLLAVSSQISPPKISKQHCLRGEEACHSTGEMNGEQQKPGLETQTQRSEYSEQQAVMESCSSE